MNCFIVVRTGVYRHEVLGVFSDKDEAVRAGTDALAVEPDRWHRYEVLERQMDVPLAAHPTPFWDTPFNEPAPIQVLKTP